MRIFRSAGIIDEIKQQLNQDNYWTDVENKNRKKSLSPQVELGLTECLT